MPFRTSLRPLASMTTSHVTLPLVALCLLVYCGQKGEEFMVVTLGSYGLRPCRQSVPQFHCPSAGQAPRFKWGFTYIFLVLRSCQWLRGMKSCYRYVVTFPAAKLFNSYFCTINAPTFLSLLCNTGEGSRDVCQVANTPNPQRKFWKLMYVPYLTCIFSPFSSLRITKMQAKSDAVFINWPLLFRGATIQSFPSKQPSLIHNHQFSQNLI